MRSKRILLMIIRVLVTNIRLACGKLVHGSSLSYSPVCCLALSDVLFVSKGGGLVLGRKFRTRGKCSINVQDCGNLIIGDDVFMNAGCQINCRHSVKIGSGCELGPNVLVYDHDHDFRSSGGIKSKDFLYEDVEIGENCWIGAGVIILKGTRIGARSVVAAGSVIKGTYVEGSLILQKRKTDVTQIEKNRG